MDKTEIGTPIQTQYLTLIPIERTSMSHNVDRRGGWCHATKQLTAIIVQTSGGVQAFDLETGRVSIGKLKETFPALDEWLNGAGGQHFGHA